MKKGILLPFKSFKMKFKVNKRKLFQSLFLNSFIKPKRVLNLEQVECFKACFLKAFNVYHQLI
jgi:hypothetical protein